MTIPSGSGNTFFLYPTVRTVSGPHPIFYAMGTGFLCRGSRGQNVKLKDNLHLAPRLIMSGTIPVNLLEPEFYI